MFSVGQKFCSKSIVVQGYAILSDLYLPYDLHYIHQINIDNYLSHMRYVINIQTFTGPVRRNVPPAIIFHIKLYLITLK